MNRSKKCRIKQRLRNRSGLTLIEVIASIGLLATLLVATMTAYSRHVRQIESSRFRINAAESADVLLSKWFSDEDEIPFPAEGCCGEDKEYSWATQRIRSERLGDREVDIVQLTIKRTSNQGEHVLQLELATKSNRNQVQR
ncbi:MAG: type II secretion system protein [Planctomycetales bacterium]|nr:type II secretion system protein [Planctomycetales bacterium]